MIRSVTASFIAVVLTGTVFAQADVVPEQCVERRSFAIVRAGSGDWAGDGAEPAAAPEASEAGYAVFPPADGFHAFGELPYSRQTFRVHGGFGMQGERFHLGNETAMDQFRSLDLQLPPNLPQYKVLGSKWFPPD